MLSIYNKISDYILVLNFDGEVIFCNESLLNRLNYSMDEVLNFNMSKLINNINTKELIKEENINIKFCNKLNEEIEINSNVTIDNFDNSKSIFIIGKEANTKQYTMDMLEDLLDNMDTSAFIVSDKGQYLYVNKIYADLLNKKKEDIIQTYNNEHWNYETYKNYEKNNSEVFKIKRPKIFNERAIVGSHECWYKSYKAPIFDDNENPKYIVGTCKDISLTKAVSEELYKNYNTAILGKNLKEIEKYNYDPKKSLSDIATHIFEYTKADGMSLLIYNEKEEHLKSTINLGSIALPLKKDEFITLKKKELQSHIYRPYCNSIIAKEELHMILNKDDLQVEDFDYFGSYTIELHDEFIGLIGISYKKGNYPRFNCDEFMIHICNIIAMTIKNIRLSEKVCMESNKRKYTEKELERYLNISVDLMAIVGADNYIKRLSNSWENVLGWSEEELLSMKITDIIDPKQVQDFHKVKKSDLVGRVTRDIIKFRHKNGKDIYLEWSSEYIQDQQLYITVARDITKKLEIENEKRKLEEAVKLEVAKNELFSNMSHEFRTPINILLGTTQVISRNIENNNIDVKSLKKHCKYIKQNSYRLLRLVNNLIDINKMDIGVYNLRCSNQNIINVIEDITQSVVVYTKNNKINLLFDTDEEEVITYCDPDKIERIMLNILSNAVKYTPEGGFINVNIKTTSENVIVSIKDNGIGIPQEKLNVIFDRFEQVNSLLTRRREGSGIGLSIVKNLVEMHGGSISVYSEEGKGSEFVFTIPIKFKEGSNEEYDIDRKNKHVERCNIEFSDIYSM
ncbi:ATP-binding protein [Terrisporobacter mayombei]|uniref:ATP-binding protein n=1 Tax=Terrisporobacter mayombei TaxID=1541 RepID=UPI002659DD2B|nr:ATP-binding protein [Terrisporobacter mayombei]MCC3668829.1 PAS domain S-box protein [Terrisporobacter mayombei]